MKSITITPKISSQGQITLPAKFLKAIGAKKGQRITLKTHGKFVAEVDSELPIMKLAGIGKGQITGGMDAVDFIHWLRDEDPETGIQRMQID